MVHLAVLCGNEDVLREGVRVLAQALMEATVTALVGADRPYTNLTRQVVSGIFGTGACPSRIRCQAATGSWPKSRQWEI